MRRVLLRYHELADNGQCVGSLIPCLPAKLLEPGALQRNICRFPVDESASFYADVCTLCLNPAPLLFARRSKKRRTTLFSAGYTSHAPQLQTYHRTTFVILVCRFVALSMSFFKVFFFLLFLFFAITNKYLYHAACAGEKERCTLAQRQAFGNAAIPLLICILSFLLVLNHIFSPAALPKPRPLPPGLDLARGRVCKFNPFCTHHQTTARDDGVAFLFSLAISRLLLHVLFLFLSFLLSFFHSYILSSFIFFFLQKKC